MNLLLDVARTYLLQRKRQTLVSVAGVAVGVGFSIAMASLMEGSNRDFIERIINYTPHVLVKDESRDPRPQAAQRAFPEAALDLRGVKPRDEPRGIRNAAALAAFAETLPGVVAAPNLTGQVVLRYGSKEVATSMVGIAPARERRVSKVEQNMVIGDFDSLYRAANGLVVGKGLARRLGAAVGDNVVATSPTGVIIQMKIVGMFRTGITAIDEGESYALLKKAQVLQDRPNIVNRVRLAVADVNAALAVAGTIERRFGYRADSWQQTNEGILQAFAIRNTIMYTTVAAILLVASFGIFNIVSTVTHEKTRDIAILKSMGFTERDMRLLFLIQGLALGLLGALLGCGLGYGLTRLLYAVPLNIETLGVEHLPVIYSPLHYLIAAAVAIVSAVLAAYLPARKAARLNPVEIVRGAA